MKRSSKQTNKRFRLSDGFGLVEIMISMAIGLIALLGLNQLVPRSHAGKKSIESRFEIAQLQQMVRSRLSCSASLGVLPSTDLPLDCASFTTLTMLDENKREIFPSGKFGDWSVSAGCVNDNIVVKAQRPGNDPLTKKPWASSQFATDIFNGTSGFCNKFFIGGCSGAYDSLIGWSNGEAVCCREENVIANSAPPYVAEAQCSAHEYMKAGGGSCWWGAVGWTNPPGSGLNVLNFGPVLMNHPDPATGKWVYDCQTNDPDLDQFAKSSALCCPKNR